MSLWLVGVDAGGTATRAGAAAPGVPRVRVAKGEGANWTVHSPRLCRERIERAVSEALPEGEAPAALCLCIAGYYPPDHAEDAERWARRTWPGKRVRVVSDVLGAWAGAFGGDPGIVLIAGTGSICFGRSAAGEEARAGGWGPLFGDQGSAYALGIASLRALADQVDGIGPATALAERLLRRRPHPERSMDLRAWLRGVYRHGWSREQIAELAPEVLVAAEEGDQVAAGLVCDAAAGLYSMAAAVARRLDGEALLLALQGGMASAPPLRTALQALLPNTPLTLVEPLLTPLEGALLLAAEASDGPDGLRRMRGTLLEARPPG